MSKQTGPKREPFQRDADFAIISAMYLQQSTQAEIAAHFLALHNTGKRPYMLSQQTISNDLKEVQKRWRDSAALNMNEAKERELERIDVLEREYWQAWEASKKDATLTRQKGVKPKEGEIVPSEATIEKRGQTGNPAYLAGVQWCIEQRCKLLGINAPTNIHLSGEVRTPIQYIEVVPPSDDSSSDPQT